MRSDNLLILNYDNYATNARNLFEKIDSSPSARELFLKDPTGVIFSSILPEASYPSRGKINQSNRLLFSLLSNPNFMKWGVEYQREIEGLVQGFGNKDSREVQKLLAVRLDKAAVAKRIVEAVFEHGDIETLYSIMISDGNNSENSCRGSSDAGLSCGDVFCHQAYILTITVAIFVFLVTQIDLTPIIASSEPSRHDLQRVAGLLAKDLQARAESARSAGVLTSLGNSRSGSTL